MNKDEERRLIKERYDYWFHRAQEVHLHIFHHAMGHSSSKRSDLDHAVSTLQYCLAVRDGIREAAQQLGIDLDERIQLKESHESN